MASQKIADRASYRVFGRPRLRGAADVAFIVALVALVVLPWHVTNRMLPHFDAADFAITSLEIAHRADDSVLDGLAAAYQHRGWRPILFPVLAVPFFVATGGHLRAGIALTQFAALLIVGLYTAALARRFTSRGRAFVATSFVLSLPWVVRYSQIFYSELTWLAFTAAWLYHAIASDGFRRGWHAALSGVALGLMVCVRPVESLLVGGPGILLLAIWARKQRPSPVRGLALACVSALALSALWWAPFVGELYKWAYAGSFGPLALTTDQRYRGLGLWPIVRDAASAYGPQQLIALTLTVILASGASRLRGSGDAPDASPTGPTAPPALDLRLVGVGIAMLTPIVATMMWTGTSSYRRFAPGFLVCFVGLALSTVRAPGPWPRLRVGALALLAAAQTALTVANGLGIRPDALEGAYVASGNNLARPDPVPDVCDTVAADVERDTRGSGPVDALVAIYSVCYFDDIYECSRRRLPWFEPSAMNAAALARRARLRFGANSGVDLADPRGLGARFQSDGYQYVLLDLFDRPEIPPSQIPYLTVTSGLIAMASKDGTIPGLDPIQRYAVGGRTVVLFRVTSGAGRDR